MPMTILEQYYQMVEHLDKNTKIALIEKLQQDIEKPMNDLSKLIANPNVVNGNSDDLVDISWEKEINLDFPKNLS